MQRSSISFILASLIIILLFATSCSNQDGSLPTLVPRSEIAPISEDSAEGESPRNGQAASGIPPTWTPPPAQEPATPVPAPDDSGAADAPDSEERYVVQAGDTLAEIAEQFSVDLERLAQANNIVDVDHIEVGQVLTIPR
ncbi:MAG: LysM peptidoglycan-binding domain-containing protein [Chloroflexota bacterium]